MTADSGLRDALEKAFDFRGDVTITKTDGSTIEGYIFDRGDGYIRLIPKASPVKVKVAWSDIADLAFSGRDMAEGKSWENWVKNYIEKKAAGETNIGLHPEQLD